jgi:hypothetical protein
MHPSILLFVLLFLPNTSLKDWRQADAPALHHLMATGAVGLMNVQTAEKDRITTEAGIQTIFAGIPMPGNAAGLTSNNNPAYSDNLENALTNSGVDVAGSIPFPQPPPPFYFPQSNRQFIAANLSDNWKKTDQEIANILDLVRRDHGILMIVSPNPSVSDYKDQRQLTPVLLWGSGVPRGVLQSRTTHVYGVISNTDIAPSIAAIMGAELPRHSSGAVIGITHDSGDICSILLKHEGDWVLQAQGMALLRLIVGAIAVLVLFAISLKDTNDRVSAALASAVTMIPLVLLLSTTIPLLLLLLVVAMIIGLKALLPDDAAPFTALSIIIFLMVDTFFFAGRLSAGSLLGYSPITGGSNIGISSYVLGVYIGAMVVMTGLWDWQGEHRRPLIILWLIAALSVALPVTGAQPGGLIICLTALAAYIQTGAGRKLTDLKAILSIVSAFALAVIALVAMHLFFPRVYSSNVFTASPSHILASLIQGEKQSSSMAFPGVWLVLLILTSIGRWQMQRRNTFAAVGTVATIACLLFAPDGIATSAICGLTVWSAEFNREVKVSPAQVINQINAPQM